MDCRAASAEVLEELVLGSSFTSMGFAPGHKPSLSSTDLLGRFVSKFARL